MDLQGLSFNRQAGDIKLTPEATLKLQAGDVVRGLVQAINNDGTVQLMVRGKSVIAETQVPLQAGQELYLQMDRMENGKLYLRVVDPQGQAELPDLALRGLLTKIGLKADDLSSTIARKLIAYNMPVTKENIEAVIKMSNLIGAENGRVLEAATYALSRNSRINNPENLANLVEFFSSPPSQDKTGQAIHQLTIFESISEAKNVSQNTVSPTQVMAESTLLAADADSAFKPAVIVNGAEMVTVSRETGSGQKVVVNNDAAKPNSVPFSFNSSDLPTVEADTALGSVLSEGEQPSTGSTPQTTANKNQAVAVADSLSTSTDSNDATPTITATNTGNQKPSGNTEAAVPKLTPSSNDTAETIITTNTGSQKLSGNAEAEAAVKTLSVPPFTTMPAETNELSNQPVTNRPAAGGENMESRLTSASGLIITNPEIEGSAVVSNSMTLSQKTTEPALPVINQALDSAAGNGNNMQRTDAAGSNTAKTEVPSQVTNQPVSSSQLENEAAVTRTVTTGPTASSDIKSGITAAALGTLMQDTDTAIDQVARRLSDLIKPALEAIITDLDQAKPDGSQIKQVLKEQQALLPEIKFARQILDQVSNGANHPVRSAIENLDQEWSGQQLYNRLEGNTARDQSNIYFTLPLRWQGQIQNAEVNINWRRDNRLRTSLPDNLTVNVGLNTINLGTVVFHLRTQNRQIGLSVYLDNDAARDQIDTAMPELLTSLSRLGYQTSYMGSQVINQPNLHPEFIDTARENLPPVTGLDLMI
ncbi:MAG: hypothetical protein ACM3NT_04095 [Methylocystaceae bacterium]